MSHPFAIDKVRSWPSSSQTCHLSDGDVPIISYLAPAYKSFKCLEKKSWHRAPQLAIAWSCRFASFSSFLFLVEWCNHSRFFFVYLTNSPLKLVCVKIREKKRRRLTQIGCLVCWCVNWNRSTETTWWNPMTVKAWRGDLNLLPRKPSNIF